MNTMLNFKNNFYCFLFIFYSSILVRDLQLIDIPLSFFTTLCLVSSIFFSVEELVGLGMSMIIFNHALQINYILFGISIVIMYRSNTKLIIKKYLLILILIAFLELIHVLEYVSICDDIGNYSRWLCMVLFVIVSINIKSIDYRKALNIFVFSTLFGMVDILLQTLSYENWYYSGIIQPKYRFGNIYLYNNSIQNAIYDNENNIALFCFISSLIAYINYKLDYNILYWIICFILCIISLLTQSRTLMLCYMIFFFLYHFRLKYSNKISLSTLKRIASLSAVTVSILCFLNKEIYGTISNILQRIHLEDGTGGRIELFRSYLEFWLSTPTTFLFGVGTQNIYHKANIYNSPHNVFSDITASMGLLGLLCFILLVYYFIKDCSKELMFLKKLKLSILLSILLFMSTLQFVSVPALFGIICIVYYIMKFKIN